MPGSALTILLEQAAEHGGTERVVELVLRRHPDARLLAPVFSASNLPAGLQPAWARRAEPIGRPRARRRPLLSPLYAREVARTPIRGASVVLSFSGHGWALAANAPGARHVSVVSGLPRSLYDDTRTYLRAEPAPLRPLLYAAVPYLRARHAQMVRRPDRLLTYSHASATALRERYGVDAEVLYPPVRAGFFTPAARERRHVLVVGRLTEHKRMEVAIEAARTAGLEVVVAGGGRCLEQLRRRFGTVATFTGWVGDDRLRELYRSAHALLCPAVEEFGIVMAEAQACGTPVVAPRHGGAVEIVRDGVTGRLTDDDSPAAFAAALRDLPLDPGACRDAGARFSEEAFAGRLAAILDAEWGVAPPPRVAVTA